MTQTGNLNAGINETSVNSSGASAHMVMSQLSRFYCESALRASVLIDLINSALISYGVKSA